MRGRESSDSSFKWCAMKRASVLSGMDGALFVCASLVYCRNGPLVNLYFTDFVDCVSAKRFRIEASTP